MLFVIKGCSLGGGLDGSGHHQCLMVTADSPCFSPPPPSSSYLTQSFVTPSVPPHFPSFPISSSSLLPPLSTPSRSRSHLAVPPIFPAPSSLLPPRQQAPAVLQSPQLLLIKLREIGCPRPNNPRERQAGRLLPPLLPSSTPLHQSQFILFPSTSSFLPFLFPQLYLCPASVLLFSTLSFLSLSHHSDLLLWFSEV